MMIASIQFLLNSISKMKREANGKGMVLYEQVLQKNFQIIETFLNKFPVIFKKQDHFEQNIKKINQRLFKYEQDSDKVREEIHLTTTLLDKKILHLKENAVRSSRSGMRASQDFTSFEQRKNSIFRINPSSSKQTKDQVAIVPFSKQKMELLNQMDNKQQESNKKVQELEVLILQMQQRLNFVSVLNGKMDQSIDKLLQQKLDKKNFQKLETQYQKKFQIFIQNLAEEKYQLGQKLIDQQVNCLEECFRRDIHEDLDQVKNKLLGELEKKAAVTEFRDQLKEIKSILEKMVQESVDSFASKEETKMALTLFEKKFSKLQIVIEEVLDKTLKTAEPDTAQGLLFGYRKQKEGIMSNFGRKRRIQK